MGNVIVTELLENFFFFCGTNFILSFYKLFHLGSGQYVIVTELLLIVYTIASVM